MNDILSSFSTFILNQTDAELIRVAEEILGTSSLHLNINEAVAVLREWWESDAECVGFALAA